MRWRFLLPASLLVGLPLATAQTEVAPTAREAPDAQAPGAKKAVTRIIDVRLKLDAQQVLISFKLANAFDKDLQDRIDSGLPTKLTFELELVRIRKSWFDKAVASATLEATATFDAVAREYQVYYYQDGDLTGGEVVKDLADLRAAMTAFNDLPLFTVTGNDAQQRLRVRIRAELHTRHLLFFIPDTVYTDWAETRKFRLSEETE